MSVIVSPLVGAYQFLSGHHVMPAAPGDAGILAIVVNTFLLTTGVMFFSLLGVVFAGLSAREGWGWAIAKAIWVSLFACIFLVNYERSVRVIGALLFVAVALSLSPMGRWIDKHSTGAQIFFQMIFIVLLLFYPGWMQSYWQFLSGRSDFSTIPLSSMKLNNWLMALIGAMLYGHAYVAFQQWRTEGKWLKDIQDRFRSR